MQILPVLDLMKGQIVRGVAGRREQYRPIVSQLTTSTQPVAVAIALQKHFGFNEFYLADLDAIRDGEPNLGVYRELQMEGFRLWIDAGVRTRHSLILKLLIVAKVANIIIALESIEHPDDVRSIVGRIGAERAVFSLDLKNGKSLGRGAWEADDPLAIARRAIDGAGIRRLIVLDLARVGVGEGVGTEELCARIKKEHPTVELIAGGGVRGFDDLNRLEANGVDWALVASALHDGRLKKEPRSK